MVLSHTADEVTQLPYLGQLKSIDTPNYLQSPCKDETVIITTICHFKPLLSPIRISLYLDANCEKYLRIFKINYYFFFCHHLKPTMSSAGPYEKLTSYATNAIGHFLPVDKATCVEMVNYALTLPSDHDIQMHFLNLLGEEEEVLTFVTKFVVLKHEAEAEEAELIRRAEKKERKELKKKSEKLPIPPATSSGHRNSKSAPIAWQPQPQSASSKIALGGRLAASALAVSTSELLDRRLASPAQAKSKRSKMRNIANLKDIEAALNELEVSADPTNNDHSQVRRVCNCMGTRHPLFEVAPNCLNCGKIICAKEGIQPCSFCGKELLSFKDKFEIIDILRHERDSLKCANEKPSRLATPEPASGKSKGKKIVISMEAGKNLWDAQDKALKKADKVKKEEHALLEQQEKEKEELVQQQGEIQYYENQRASNPDLQKAQERLETLLNFQATGAERTKIIDNAADYDLPGSTSGSMWLSPMERALQLKKQQKQLRKYENSEKERSGRGKKVMDMVIRDGKAMWIEREGSGTHSDDEMESKEDEQINAMEDTIKHAKNAKENEMILLIWNYEKESEKWDKPRYIASKDLEVDTNAIRVASKVRNDVVDTNELVVMI